MEAETSEPEDELIQNLLAPAPSEPFEFERIDQQGRTKRWLLRVRWLRVEEKDLAIQRAQEYAKSRGEDPKKYNDIYKEAQAVEMCTLFLCRPTMRERPDGTKYYPQLFTSSDQVRQSLFGPELAQCLNMYEIVQAKYGRLQGFNLDDIESWAERLSSERGVYFLSRLDSDHWPVAVMAFASAWGEARRELGRPLTNSLDGTGSDLESSSEDTGDFSKLPDARSSEFDDVTLPTDHMIDREEAEKLGKKINPKERGETPDKDE